MQPSGVSLVCIDVSCMYSLIMLVKDLDSVQWTHVQQLRVLITQP